MQVWAGITPGGARRSSKGCAMTTRPDMPILPFDSRASWESWLAEHHETSNGLWLKIAKNGSGIETVSYTEALDAALCYGWIDGQKGRFDEDYWLQRFTPRGPRSKWSKVNREKAARLMESDEMKPPGLREVERARADGRWDAAYEAQSRATVPEDLQRKLEKNEGPESSSLRSTARTDTRSCTGSRMPKSPRPGPDASRNT